MTKGTDILTVASDEMAAREYIKRLRWLCPDGVVRVKCPHCGSYHIYNLNDGGYKCGTCLKKFSVTSGSIFHSTKLSLRLWCYAIYFWQINKRGISSVQLSKYLGVTYKTSWLMMMKLRSIINTDSVKLQNMVSIDEVYLGGLWSNKHYKIIPQGKKAKYAENARFKTPIIGMVESTSEGDRKLLLNVVPEVSLEVIHDLVYSKINRYYLNDKGFPDRTIINSDGSHMYKQFEYAFELHQVNHTKNIYMDDEGYTSNPIECAFSHVQRFYNGTHIHISRKYLQLYLNEFEVRYCKEVIDLSNIDFNLVHTKHAIMAV